MKDQHSTGGGGPQRRRHYALLSIPFLWQVGAVPWANGVDIPSLPIPFLMLWEMAGIGVTSIVLAAMFRIDERPK